MKSGLPERLDAHKRTRTRKAEIEAARARLSQLDRAGDEVLDVVARRLWDALGLDAEYERIRREKQAGKLPIPRELGGFKVHVKPDAAETLTGRGRILTR